jgi:hypothetical protein
MKIYLNRAERNMFFGHSGNWTQGMITRHLHHQHADKVMTPCRPNTHMASYEKYHCGIKEPTARLSALQRDNSGFM